MYEILKEDRESLFSVRLTDHVTRAELRELADHVESRLRSHETIDLLLCLDASFSDWEKGLGFGDLSILAKNAGRIRRVAAVADKKWESLFQSGQAMARSFFRLESRFFEPSQQSEALSWLAFE